jgi:hypothetical protein
VAKATQRKKVPRKRKFGGELDKPIVRPNSLATALRLYGKSPEEQAATLRRLEDEIDAAVGRKLLLLAERYGIKIETGHEWRQVCLRLAQECEVAGFRIVEGLDHERPGRPKGSSEIDSFALFKEVEALKARGKSVANACKILFKRDPWRSAASAASLETKYHTYKRRLDAIHRSVTRNEN